MIMKQLIYVIITIVCIFFRANAENRPLAFLKVEYKEIATEKIFENGDSLITKYDYVLQIGRDQSFYHDPRQYYVDSLRNDPQGKIVYEEIDIKALHMGGDWFKNRAKLGIGGGKKRMVRKDFTAFRNEVWDSSLGDKYHYFVPMDITWEIADSVKTILDYECQLAITDYHGRRWEAWFCPEIPVQDGPWQLCGLPGLIMEAKTLDNMFAFIISGIQECDEPLKEPFNQDDYFNSNRKTFLKTKKLGLDNLAASISARTGGAVKLNSNKVFIWCDLIETDYK